MNILFLPEVEDYLFEVIEILHQQDYFSFEESAILYITNLVEQIKTELPVKLKRPAPEYFNRYGNKMLYSVFKKNNQTQWYVFYTIYQVGNEKIALVRYISNNHLIAQQF